MSYALLRQSPALLLMYLTRLRSLLSLSPLTSIDATLTAPPSQRSRQPSLSATAQRSRTARIARIALAPNEAGCWRAIFFLFGSLRNLRGVFDVHRAPQQKLACPREAPQIGRN